ncbi:efflux RND transporter periplasmic adaptor subunit [Acidomonas methanolica]|uniref:Multidrug resistance efflux pump acriflavin resistance protein HlyD/AcrB/AcrD/AcrF n=1 Tax=Acidomonas methanolica NBRC 104435 TaxID=1231351 RepID=A0A023D4H0_ACIMT|nr:efflux RND transporter periplasmic adaptor subunit [Acidomonas methanolica]MBU2653954.1 efflux RND transporter periplasmic adaptor subunit [Acidomonas methanolica]TCS30915.1 multidrug efflux system membrane fusion protein [Acidomonas methanolica]GAJ28676.1 multidrug resistance efflux pump acriflavin resistance protein HlyD/AcrB/AcrD/AcrF [Acidomonas methanolica NBRC 104435]GBQ48830.1 multidrug efflux pump acriflavin resistance protein AcrB/AcrD/AcrF [Acidomonas methanolica]GEK98288.1 transp
MDEQTARPSQDRQLHATTTPPSRKKRWVAIGLLAVFIALIAVAFLRPHHKTGMAGPGRHAQTGDQPTPVGVAQVKTGDMPVVLTLLGTVVPITNVTVEARVTGYLMQVNFKEGQHVNQGDELELIDPRPYQVVVDQWEGTLAQDSALLAAARINNRRYQTLLKQNSTAAMTAVNQEYTVKQYEGTVKYDQAQLDAARLNVMYCHIIAPVSGRIGIRGVDKGNYVTGGSTTLGTLTQMQPISVIFTVPQNELPRVIDRMSAVGMLPVQAWDAANENRIADGTVKALDSQIDTATGTVRMRGIFPNEDEHLFPNQFVNARLMVDTLHNVMLVPSNALQTGPNGQFVYVVQPDNTVAVHLVKIGIASNDTTVVVSGVKPGDRVVTDGTNHLRPGAKVTIAADAPAPASGGQ